MKLVSKVMITLACSALSLGAFAYEDPQTDHDSLYFTKADNAHDDRVVVDLAVLETVERKDSTHARVVDPQTDYDSVHMTNYMEGLQR